MSHFPDASPYKSPTTSSFLPSLPHHSLFLQMPSSSKRDTLLFNKPLISSPNNSISTKELLSRLQTLSDELSSVDQNNVDVKSFLKLAADLVNKKLLKHPNSAIQAYVCCCLSDILRLYAPDAPFTASELSLVFDAFFRQLSFLAEKENPYSLQHNYLLKRLAEVRSVILITDLPDANRLIESMFETFYGLTTKDFPARLEPLVSEMLAEVVSEAESVPTAVLKQVLNKFLTRSETITANSNILNPGFNFSLAVCEANVDKMARQMAQLFSEMLSDTTPNEDSANGTITPETLRALEKIHKLSILIWKYVPDLLSAVMGLINDELNTDNETVRLLATASIGSMISHTSPGTEKASSFVIAHSSTWLNWLKKSLDVSPAVRSKWVEQLPAIFNSSSSSTTDITTELCSGLTKCLLDNNDKVRLAACEAVEAVSFEILTSKVCNKVILNTLFQLIREKNADCRKKAITLLCDIYNKYSAAISESLVVNFGSLEEGEITEVENLISDGIPNHILGLNYINDRTVTATVDLVLFEKLLPFENDAAKRTKRLLRFYSSLSEKSKTSFTAIIKRQQKQANALENFVQIAEEFAKGGSLDHNNENKENHVAESAKATASDDTIDKRNTLFSKLDKILNWLCVSYPDGLKTHACFERFYKLKNARFLNLINFCISPESDYKTVKNSIKELLAKLQDPKLIRLENDKTHITTTDMVTNFKILLYRSSTILYNRSTVAELFVYTKDLKHPFNPSANDILESVSSIIPDVLKFQINDLVDLVNENRAISGFNPRANSLRTIYHFVKKFLDQFPENQDFFSTLTSLALTGSPREAKYSLKLIGLSNRKESVISDLVSKILPLNLEHENFVCHLSTIAEVFLVDPQALEDHVSDISAFLIENVIRTNRFEGEEVAMNDDRWIEDISLDFDYKKHHVIYEKILALRIIMNRLRSLASVGALTVSNDEFKNTVEKPLKLLELLVGRGGEIINTKTGSQPTPKYFQQKLRLYAGFSILKLAKYPAFNDLISYRVVNVLSALLHDLKEEIRSEFCKKLEKNLFIGTILEKFLHLVFLMGHEPEASLKQQVSTWILSGHKRAVAKQDIKFERVLVRLIHAISHDQRFIGLTTQEENTTASFVSAYSYALEFLIFYLTNVAKADNMSLLYYFASRIKQYRDATVAPSLYSKTELSGEVLNLYRISELSQLIIKELGVARNWSMQTWPGKIKLPADLFSPMENYEEAQRVVTHVFIPDDVQVELSKRFRAKLKGHGYRRRAEEGVSSKPKRVRVDNKTAKPQKKARKMASNNVDSPLPARKSTRVSNKISYDEGESSGLDNEDSDSEYE